MTMQLSRQVDQLCQTGRAAEALALLHRHDADADGAAALILGQWHVAGIYVARDFRRALRYLQAAAERGSTLGEAGLSALLARGADDVARDWGAAMRSLRVQARRDPLAARQIELLGSMALDENGDPLPSFEPVFRSRDPLVVQFGSFLTPAECDMLIDMAGPKLAPAQVVHPATGQMVRDPIRTSHNAAFPILEETPFLHAVNRRIAKASRSQPEQGEPTQILAYSPGQEYRMHSDALPGEANQRIQTFLIYLSDDFEGGATYFPHGDLSLRPAKGDALCFSNVDSAMRPASSARHAGLPVTRGTKYILSKWIRQRPLDLACPSHSAPN